MSDPNAIKERQMNQVKFFHKHIVEGKKVTECAKEMGLHRITLHGYKKTDDFRKMALEHLDNSSLKGLGGTVSKLVNALDAEKPIVVTNSDGSTSIRNVADETTRMKALQEVIKIYGLYAPQKTDVKLDISLSSDEEIFGQIDEAQRACKSVESHETGQGSPGVAQIEQRGDSGGFEARQRTILQDAAVPEP